MWTALAQILYLLNCYEYSPLDPHTEVRAREGGSLLSRTGRVLAAAATSAVIAAGGIAASDTASAAVTQTATSTVTHSATASPLHHYAGRIVTRFQYRSGAIRVSGFMIDNLHPRAQTLGCIYIAGRCVHKLRADRPSPRFDRRHHVRGPHRFVLTLRPRRPGVRLVLRSLYRARFLDAVHATSPGKRVVRVARRYVGSRYVWGGASPSGFDCSGYVMYSYRHGRVAGLPHNANSQRFAPHMHRISRRDARPGDLVFYFSGGRAYHVAIFAGRGMQYSATDPAQGVEYAHITARNIEFGTDWHR